MSDSVTGERAVSNKPEWIITKKRDVLDFGNIDLQTTRNTYSRDLPETFKTHLVASFSSTAQLQQDNINFYLIKNSGRPVREILGKILPTNKKEIHLANAPHLFYVLLGQQTNINPVTKIIISNYTFDSVALSFYKNNITVTADAVGNMPKFIFSIDEAQEPKTVDPLTTDLQPTKDLVRAYCTHLTTLSAYDENKKMEFIKTFMSINAGSSNNVDISSCLSYYFTHIFPYYDAFFQSFDMDCTSNVNTSYKNAVLSVHRSVIDSFVALDDIKALNFSFIDATSSSIKEKTAKQCMSLCAIDTSCKALTFSDQNAGRIGTCGIHTPINMNPNAFINQMVWKKVIGDMKHDGVRSGIVNSSRVVRIQLLPGKEYTSRDSIVLYSKFVLVLDTGDLATIQNLISNKLGVEIIFTVNDNDNLESTIEILFKNQDIVTDGIYMAFIINDTKFKEKTLKKIVYNIKTEEDLALIGATILVNAINNINITPNVGSSILTIVSNYLVASSEVKKAVQDSLKLQNHDDVLRYIFSRVPAGSYNDKLIGDVSSGLLEEATTAVFNAFIETYAPNVSVGA